MTKQYKKHPFTSLWLGIFLLFAVLFFASDVQPANQVEAATVRFQYTYNGKKKTYTGEEEKYPIQWKECIFNQYTAFCVE